MPPRADAPLDDAPKDEWRRWALERRRTRTNAEITAARQAIVGHLTRRLADCAAVCCYLPLRTEPLAPDLQAVLVTAGIRVLVPVTRPDAPLDWAEYRIGDRTSVGPLGAPEPADPRPDRDGALGAVDVVLVPALLVDSRGTRLGRGGGHYDRSFADSALGRVPQRIAVLFDDERVPVLPADDFDVPVHAVVTPTGGVHRSAPQPRSEHG